MSLLNKVVSTSVWISVIIFQTMKEIKSIIFFCLLTLLVGCESYVKFELGRFVIGLIAAPIVGLIGYLIIKGFSKKD